MEDHLFLQIYNMVHLVVSRQGKRGFRLKKEKTLVRRFNNCNGRQNKQPQNYKKNKTREGLSFEVRHKIKIK